MEIRECLEDKKYRRIIYFLSSKSINSIDALSEEEISKIVFIPGVDMTTLQEAKELLLDAINQAIDDIPDLKLISQNNYERTESSYHTSAEFDSIDQSISVDHTNTGLKLDVFLSDIPRSHYFVRYCNSKNLMYVDEVDDSILNELMHMRNIGVSTAEKIRDRFRKVSSCDNHTNITYGYDLPIDIAFGQVSKGKIFIDFCYQNGYRKISDLIGFRFDQIDIKGITAYSLSRIKRQFLSIIENHNFSFELREIHPMYKMIPLSCFIDPDTELMHNIADRDISVGEFLASANAYRYTLALDYLNGLYESPISIFEQKIHDLKNQDYVCLLERSKGKTLQVIGDTLGVTRERIRQIVVKNVNRLETEVKVIAYILSDCKNKVFSSEDIEKLEFSSAENRQLYMFILEQIGSSGFVTLKFSDLIVPDNMIPDNYETTLSNIFKSIVSDGIDYEDMMNYLSEELYNLGMPFLSSSDIESFLVCNGYNIHGRFVMPRKSSYALACLNAIEENFEFDIKLDSDEENPDLNKLRLIMQNYYPGVKLGDSNRALSARLMDHMILSGRGRYCPISRMTINNQLFNDIYDYVMGSEQQSFYFSELYEKFESRLNAESQVYNKYYMQGILKYLYSDFFDMDRDALMKSGSEKERIDDRIASLLIASGKGMSYSEVMSSIPGMTVTVLTFVVGRNKDIIYWGSNHINHISNLQIDTKLEKTCRNVIDMYCSEYGYISSHILFDNIMNNFPEVLMENNISDPIRLYYVVQYLFSDIYNISRAPHILKKNIVDISSSYEIIKHFTMRNHTIHKDRIDAFSDEFKWSSPTVGTIFNDIDKEFIRISEKEYLFAEGFSIPDCFIHEFEQAVSCQLGDYSFYPIANIYDFSTFPKLKFTWNQFILESLIKFYSNKFSVISPKVKDRRYMRSIIVKSGSYDSYEELIISIIKQNNSDRINEFDLMNLLTNEGIATERIPKELYNGQNIYFRGESFILT